ncbi:MAG: hypothetical protein R3B72_01325 [Polyangiaceae bacterium]
MKPGTLTRWAREGRLRAFTVERGRLVCWESDLRDAIEAEPVTPAPVASSARAVADDDEQLAALSAMGGAS